MRFCLVFTIYYMFIFYKATRRIRSDERVRNDTYQHEIELG